MAISNNNTGIRTGVCTSTTRPTAPYEGQHIYETDTDIEYVWNGSAWVVNYVSANSPAFTGTPTAPTAAAGTNTTQLATMASRPWNIPWGKVAANYNATNYGLTTANVGFTVSSLTGTITAGRAYLVSGQLVFQPYVNSCSQQMLYVTGSGLTLRTLYYQGGVITPAYTMIPMSGSQQYTAAELGVTSGTASVTLNCIIRTNTGGYVNEDPDGVLGANTARANFRIEDIGPV